MKLFLMLAAAGGATGDITEDRLERRLDAVLGEGRFASGVAAKTYRERLGGGASAREVWSAFLTDYTFRIPAIRLAERQAVHQARTFMYQFTQPSPIFGGAAHAVEIPFVFDNLDKNGIEMLLGPIDGHLQSLAAAMADAWTTFARTGVPAAQGLPEWTPYEPQHRATLVVGLDRQIVEDPQGDERSLWDGLLM
jgi:carboxylesterase type B